MSTYGRTRRRTPLEPQAAGERPRPVVANVSRLTHLRRRPGNAINVASLEDIDCLAQGLSSGHLQRIFLENVSHVRGQAATCTPRNPRVTRGIWVVWRDRSVQTSASSGDGPSLGKEVHSAADALPPWRWVNVRAQLTSRLQDLQHRRPPLVSLTESSVSTYDILTRVMNRGEGMLMSVHLVSSEQHMPVVKLTDATELPYHLHCMSQGYV